MPDIVWIGLDLAKHNFEAAIDLARLANPARQPAQSFPTSDAGIKRLLEWADSQIARHCPGAAVRIVMEATGKYSLLVSAWLLNERPSCQPAIVNPAYIKAFGQSLGARNKTDKADARIIARYGRERQPVAELPPSPATARLRELVRERAAIVAELTAEKNRSGEPCQDKFIVRLRNQRMKMLEKQIEELEREIRKVIAGDELLRRDVRLLDSIPGVGLVVAATVLGELGDLRRFSTARKLSAFAGMAPRQCQSGSSVLKPTRMDRMGSPAVRALLYMAAISAVSSKQPIKTTYTKMVATGKSKMASVIAFGRKLLVLMRAVLISGKPYDPNYIRPVKNSVQTLVKGPLKGI